MNSDLWIPGLAFLMAAIRTAGSAAGDGAAAAEAALPGKRGDYRGYERHDFVVDGCATIVVVPKEPAAGKPWAWRAEFFDAFPQVDLAVLARAFHLVYIGVGNTFGWPDALAHWDVLYRELTEKYGSSLKPVLKGLSRGGPYCFNWAADNTDRVACILADKAVLDFKSWPGGKGKGKGSPGGMEHAGVPGGGARSEGTRAAGAGRALHAARGWGLISDFPLPIEKRGGQGASPSGALGESEMGNRQSEIPSVPCWAWKEALEAGSGLVRRGPVGQGRRRRLPACSRGPRAGRLD